jgi:large subunit ribosomal protein L23
MAKITSKILEYPHLTEKSVGLVDEQNTLVFIVDTRSSKGEIKNAVEEMFNVKVEKVNTQITRKGKKKAYVKLGPEHEALDIATKLGML